MVDNARRKELLRQYAEDRPPQDGVFALRNSATGETWVGVSRNLDAQKNGLWARLAGGRLSNVDVQASWKTSGEAAFSYDILERFTETDTHAIELLRMERAAHWRQELGAGTIKGT